MLLGLLQFESAELKAGLLVPLLTSFLISFTYTLESRVTPAEKRRFLAQRAQETEQRRALFNAGTDAETT